MLRAPGRHGLQQLLRAVAAACSGQLQPTAALPPLLQQCTPAAARSVCQLTKQQQKQLLARVAGGTPCFAQQLQRQQQQQLPRLLQQQHHPQLTPQLLQQQQQRCMATRVEQQQAANPGLKFWKPTSPGVRGRVTIRRTGIWKGRPLRCLSQGTTRQGGRNAYGRITVRHRGGGPKRRLRLVDFTRRPAPGPGLVERLEHDPNRSGYIALVRYQAPEPQAPPSYAYILAPQDLQPGDTVASGPGVAIKPGNTLPLKDIPVGMPINSIELHPGKGGALCRAAGCMATIVNKQEQHAIVRLPSGEQRLINLQCRATVGAVSNPQHKNRVLGSAGAARHLGRRPTVRGVAMNPVDHPMGGGTAGGRPSCSPWGLHAKGKKTRDRHKASNRWILGKRAKRSAKGRG